MTAPALRWGVLGTGWIAEKFAAALHTYTTQRMYAVGSRSAESARRFAAQVGAEAAYGSYDELVADPAVDVVYVATPHNLHLPNALLAIEAGKHVLVEKPLALTGAEGRAIAAAAERAGVFCMEALWTLFLPRYDVVGQLLADGAVGRVDTVVADFGQFFAEDHRIFRADLAGGPLWDLLTYPLTLATWALGQPTQVLATGSPAPNGLNGQLGVLLRTATGQIAALHSTILGETPTTAAIAGSDGWVALDAPFYTPGGVTLTTRAGEVLTYDEPNIMHGGLHYQAAEVARRVAAGETGSPVRPLADSVAMLDTFDEIRRQVGIPLP
jgi:predicted dehydrogenase